MHYFQLRSLYNAEELYKVLVDLTAFKRRIQRGRYIWFLNHLLMLINIMWRWLFGFSVEIKQFIKMILHFLLFFLLKICEKFLFWQCKWTCGKLDRNFCINACSCIDMHLELAKFGQAVIDSCQHSTSLWTLLLIYLLIFYHSFSNLLRWRIISRHILCCWYHRIEKLYFADCCVYGD